MGVFVGSTELTTVGELKIGSASVQEVYVGSTLVFPSGLQTGADASVLTNSFDVQAYATSRGFGTIPTESGTVADPLSFGAVGNGVADDTTAVQNAMNSLPTTAGGTLDLSNGIFGVSNNDDIIQIGNKSNITIKGGGWSRGSAQTSGLRALGVDQTNRFNAVLRYTPTTNNTNLVIKDLEIDVNNQQFGGITTQADDGTWIIGCFVHDSGDGGSGSPLAAIKGVNTQENLRIIGNIVENTSAAGTSAVRGIWTTEDDFIAGVVAHNIVIRTGHSGIILHVGVGGTCYCEFNTVKNGSLNTGGALFKPERSGLITGSTYQPPLTQAIYRRNYGLMDDPEPTGPQGPWFFQLEGTGDTIEENLGEGCQRAFASFNQGQGMRNMLVRNNIVSDIREYGVFWDPQSDINDTTLLRVENNTLSGPASFEFGVQFHPNWQTNTAAFDFNNVITVIDNNISGNFGADVDAPSSVTGYVNYTNSGNGSSAPGALVTLIAPAYAAGL